MKFKFRLQKLLEYREQLKKEAEQEYQAAMSDLALAEKKLQDLFDSIHNSFQYIGNPAQGNVELSKSSVGLVNYTEGYIRGQKYKVELQKQQINELQLIAEDKKEKMVELATDFHVLEKLRERSFEEFKQERRRKETKEIDDLVVMTHGKKAVS